MDKIYYLLLVFIFLINSTAASSFDFTFSNITNINQEINISIINFNLTNIYDVKIYVHNSSDGKIERSEIISNTFNSGIWQDSWNYISSSFPNMLNYNIKLKSYCNNNIICVKLRKSNSSQTEELCKSFVQQLENSFNSKNISNSTYIFSTNLQTLRFSLIIATFILTLIILIIITLETSY